MTEPKVLTPTTPTSWIIARLREDGPLMTLLGDGDGVYPNRDWGPHNAMAPIYKANEVPPEHPARFVVVRPPLNHSTEYYANIAPRSMDSVYLIWAETRTDQLPPGTDLDGVLDPMYQRIVAALRGVRVPEAITGYVLQSQVLDAYTPLPVKLTESIKVGQMGIQLALISSV